MSIPTMGFSEAAVHSLWLSSETILLTHYAYYIKEILSKKDKKVCIFMQPFLYFLKSASSVAANAPAVLTAALEKLFSFQSKISFFESY